MKELRDLVVPVRNLKTLVTIQPFQKVEFVSDTSTNKKWTCEQFFRPKFASIRNFQKMPVGTFVAIFRSNAA